MLELPETTVLAGQLNDMVVGRTIDEVLPPTKPHMLVPTDFVRQ
jgi:hypothetical protein